MSSSYAKESGDVYLSIKPRLIAAVSVRIRGLGRPIGKCTAVSHSPRFDELMSGDQEDVTVGAGLAFFVASAELDLSRIGSRTT